MAMRSNPSCCLLLAAWLACFAGQPALAGKFNRVLSVGDKAPDFSKLPDTEGRPHSLADYEEAKLVVVVFTANHCPVAQAYQQRLIRLQDDYRGRGLRLMAISCSRDAADRPAAMKERAEQERYNFPYLYDESQQSGQAYGALKTPTVFVLDEDRNVRYMGAIDDSWRDESKVKRAHLRDALDALLAGKPPRTDETRPEGCEINYVEPPEAAESSDARIERLIAELGHEDYFVRERAQHDLLAIGFEAFDLLTAAEEHDDLEIATRARYLVRRMRIEWITEADPPAVKALMADYEAAAEKDRLKIVEQLAALPDGAGLNVLCRMVRFEKSPALSKHAALAVINQKDAESDPARREQAIERGVGRSQRPGAEWLRLYLRGPHDPESAADDWGKVAEAEEQLLRQAPQQTREAIVTGVWRQRVTWLRKLGRRDEAVAAMMKLASREQQSSRTLTELIQWLVAEQAYSMVDEVAKRFADRIEQDPLLLYTLADAREAQGNEALARETAERALKLNEGDQRQHWIVGDALQRRGQRKWAEGEYNLVIGQGEPGAPITLISQFRLAELMHDRGDDLAAAGVLEAAVKAMEANVKQGREEDNLGRDVTAVASRLYFFQACHLDTKGDYAGHVERLEQALAQDPLDADVLIALYRLASATPEQKERTREGIRNAADEFRRQIQRHPEDSTPYNQLAWLVSNTEGDQKEALESSLKSLELVRTSEESRVNEAGYLDTLAHCYYAQGDFERAVQTQSKAVELDPHSGLMNKQLALFREALAKSKQDQQ